MITTQSPNGSPALEAAALGQMLDAPAPEAPASGASGPETPEAERPRGRTNWSAWLLVLALAGAAAAGGYRLAEQRSEAPTTLALGQVLLTGESVPIGPDEAAVVSAVNVRSGQQVAAGDLLARLSPTASQRASARGRLAPQVLVAPSDAVVVAVDRIPGSVVQGGSPVVTLYTPSSLAFRTTISVSELESLRVGMLATVEGPALTEPVEAVVGHVVPELGGVQDPNHVVITLTPRDPASIANLVPGLPFSATVDLTSAPPAAPPVGDAVA